MEDYIKGNFLPGEPERHAKELTLVLYKQQAIIEDLFQRIDEIDKDQAKEMMQTALDRLEMYGEDIFKGHYYPHHKHYSPYHVYHTLKLPPPPPPYLSNPTYGRSCEMIMYLFNLAKQLVPEMNTNLEALCMLYWSVMGLMGFLQTWKHPSERDDREVDSEIDTGMAEINNFLVKHFGREKEKSIEITIKANQWLEENYGENKVSPEIDEFVEKYREEDSKNLLRKI